MADFSELCPLFETGVFSEVTFPKVTLTHVSPSGNALIGTILTHSHKGWFTFGRTVIVTGAYVRPRVQVTVSQSVWLARYGSEQAIPTVFGTIKIDATATEEKYTYRPITIATPATFASNDVLGLTVGTVTEDGAGTYDLIVRYKEK